MQVRSALFYAVVLMTGVPVVALATSIAGIWTEKQITIAADSKQTITQGQTITGSQPACKIYEVRGLVFALAGLAEAEQISVTDEIRNSRELVEQGTGRKLPETSVVVAADAAVVKVLKARRTASDPNVPIQLLIGGMIDGKLQMFRIEMVGMSIQGDYSFANSTRRIAYPESRGYNGTDPNRGIELIGIRDSAMRFQASLPEWNKGDDVTVARRLVAVEASDTVASHFVGPPISTIVIDKKGIRWVDKGACEWNPSKPIKQGRK
jgi:hypothetical protein